MDDIWLPRRHDRKLIGVSLPHIIYQNLYFYKYAV